MRDVWNTAELREWDKKHCWHPFTQMKDWCEGEPLVLVGGGGAIVWDSEGRKYIDGNSSIWTNIHGHCHPGITRAIQEQAARIAHVSFLGTSNPPAAELAARLTALFPQQTLTRVFYSDDGSTAVEAAIKMAVQYWQLVGQPQRGTFVAFDQAYHGDTAGAASLGGIGTFNDRFAGHHFPVLRISTAGELDTLPSFQRGEIAAVIIEPLVQGAAGIRLWQKGMLRELREKCDATGTLLILDEVLTGFGRTGTLFACEQENVIPDFLCLAKGLTGGYVPLAATLTNENIFSAFLGEFHEQKTFYYGHSYTANAIGCAAALANLNAFRDEHTLESLQPKIGFLRALLGDVARHRHVRDVRHCGLISGIEVGNSDGAPFVWSERTGGRICEAARHHGLLTRPVLDAIVFMPPLCITEPQIESGVAAIVRAIDDVLG